MTAWLVMPLVSCVIGFCLGRRRARLVEARRSLGRMGETEWQRTERQVRTWSE